MDTDHKARALIRSYGCTYRKVDGEYRVCLKGATEAQAYYTDDRADAVHTAYWMSLRNERGAA